MNDQLKEFVRKFLPRSIRPYRILAGPLRGRILYTSLHDYPGAVRGTTESDLVAWLTQNIQPGTVWLDIGAHYGYISLLMALLVGSEGRVYSFEPMLTTAGYLNLTRQANRVENMTILPLALSDNQEASLASFPTTRGMADSTLNSSDGVESLLQISLDRIWNGITGGGQKVDGVKIDVQGMELEVLRGMKNLLGIRRPVLLIEIHRGVDRSAINDLLSGLGYSVPGKPLAVKEDSRTAAYLDDHTYVFHPYSQ